MMRYIAAILAGLLLLTGCGTKEPDYDKAAREFERAGVEMADDPEQRAEELFMMCHMKEALDEDTVLMFFRVEDGLADDETRGLLKTLDTLVCNRLEN